MARIPEALLLVLTMSNRTLRQITAVFFMCLVLSSHACVNGKSRPFPTCLVGVCVGKKAPTESALKSRFGGQPIDLGYRTRGYCYALTYRAQMAHLVFVLKNFGDGWRVVSVRAAARQICAKAMPLKQYLQLKTGEGITLGGQWRAYARPTVLPLTRWIRIR